MLTYLSFILNKKPDAFFRGVTGMVIVTLGLLVTYGVTGVIIYLLSGDMPLYTPGSSLERVFIAMSSANVAPTDWALFICSVVYLCIEIILLFIIMVSADIAYAWLLFEKSKPKKQSDNKGPQSIWIRTLVYWLGFGLGGIATGISSVGLGTLIVSDNSLQGLFSENPLWFCTTIGGILGLYVCSGVVWILGDNMRKRPHIHLYLNGALMIVDPIMLIITYSYSCGILLTVAINPIVYCLVFLFYKQIHRVCRPAILRLKSLTIFSRFTQEPVEVAGKLFNKYYGTIILYLVVSKWSIWCSGFLSDPNTIEVPLEIKGYVLYMLNIAPFVIFVAWCYVSYRLIGTCLRLEKLTARAKIVLPVEPALIWQMLVGDMVDLLKVSYLKHLYLNGYPLTLANRVQALPSWNIRIRCLAVSLLHPTVGLTKRWLQILIIKKIIYPGSYDELFVMFTWKGVLLLGVRGASTAAAVSGVVTLGFAAIIGYEAVDQPRQLWGAINTIAESPGMREAIATNKYGLGKKMTTTCHHAAHLATSSTSTRLVSGLLHGPFGIGSGSNHYTKSVDGVWDILKAANKAGVDINTTPSNSTTPNRILKTVKDYVDLSEGNF